MMNKTALYYLEHLDAFQIMESHIMDRVMQEYWMSNLDSSGSIFGASTTYSILTHQDGELCQYDYERKNRFYAKMADREVSTPHKFNFMVIRRSMSVRYFMEMIFFFALALKFQLAVF